MKQVRYANRRMVTGQHRPLIVGEDVAAEIKATCETRSAEMSIDLLIVEVGCWDRALEIARTAQQNGHEIFRLARKF